MEAHPLASMFPLIEGPAFDAMVASIKRDGLVLPIIINKGMILDGRNRYRACLAAGIEPHFLEVADKSDAELARIVETFNLSRRHQSAGEIALLAVKFSELTGTPLVKAAGQFGVSPRTAEKARKVLKSAASNVIELVKTGDVSIHRAYSTLGQEQTLGKLKEDGRRTGPKPGNRRVQALKRALELMAACAEHEDVIVKHWPGDPEVNRRLSVVGQFLASLSTKTREFDHAVASA
jgi:hypothetical protein